jgi:hypothetical protein
LATECMEADSTCTTGTTDTGTTGTTNTGTT